MSSLILGGTDVVDDWPNFDLVSNVDVGLSGMGSDGFFYFSGGNATDCPIDLGRVYTCRLTAHILVEGLDVYSSIDLMENIDQMKNFDGADPSEYSVTLQVKTTNKSKTADTPGWSDWKNFTVGDWTARSFDFRLKLHSDVVGITPMVTELRVSIDMPDRTEGQSNITAPATGYSVFFSPSFYATPAISITMRDGSSGDYWLITDESPHGFTVTFYDSTDTPVARTFNWVAKGYGYVYTGTDLNYPWSLQGFGWWLDAQDSGSMTFRGSQIMTWSDSSDSDVTFGYEMIGWWFSLGNGSRQSVLSFYDAPYYRNYPYYSTNQGLSAVEFNNLTPLFGGTIDMWLPAQGDIMEEVEDFTILMAIENDQTLAGFWGSLLYQDYQGFFELDASFNEDGEPVKYIFIGTWQFYEPFLDPQLLIQFGDGDTGWLEIYHDVATEDEFRIIAVRFTNNPDPLGGIGTATVDLFLNGSTTPVATVTGPFDLTNWKIGQQYDLPPGESGSIFSPRIRVGGTFPGTYNHDYVFFERALANDEVVRQMGFLNEKNNSLAY